MPGGPSDLGYSWPGVFLLGASGRTERFFTQLLFHYPISVTFSTSFDGGTVSSHLWILLSVVFQVLFIVQLNESNNNDCYKFFKTVYIEIIRGLDAILGK